MEKLRQAPKIISIFSNVACNGKAEYAINLATAIAKIARARVLLVCNKECIIDPSAGIDKVLMERVDKESIDKIKQGYGYVLIDLLVDHGENEYEMFYCSDSIHFFLESTRDSLEKGHEFLQGLVTKGLGEVSNRFKVVVHNLDIFDRLSLEEMAWLIRRDVWAGVPEQGMAETSIDTKGMPLVIRSPEDAYSRSLIHIAKRESGMLLGLALGSGAAFGLAHIGVLKVLEKNRIPIDIISGSSIGALIAIMWGIGLSPGKIEQIAGRLKHKLNIMRLLDFTMPISGILAGNRLKRFLKGIFGEKTFEDLKIPVKIIVYDLANRETLVMEKGLLLDAVYMSMAVPGIFEPKIEKTRVIIDGGVSEPVPVDALSKEGVKKIIAVNVLPGPADIHERNMLLKKRLEDEENLVCSSSFCIKAVVLLKKFFRGVFTPNIFDVIMTSMQSMEYVLAEEACRKASVSLHPVYADAGSIDFHLVRHFIKRGEEEAGSKLAEIKKLAFE